MSSMKDRAEGFEKRFTLDEELQFKAFARRNRALGMWAAQKLRKTGPEAEIYIREVILCDMQEAGDEDVFRKICDDFKSHGVEFSGEEIRALMDELLVCAEKEVRGADHEEAFSLG